MQLPALAAEAGMLKVMQLPREKDKVKGWAEE
jgi:hypothetical protein